MQVEAEASVCPACGAGALERFAVLHHMICAYVGPEYDFAPEPGGCMCPKCRRPIVPGDRACEIVGTSVRCVRCRSEATVFPPPNFGGKELGPR